jgi:hypothetical protein
MTSLGRWTRRSAGVAALAAVVLGPTPDAWAGLHPTVTFDSGLVVLVPGETLAVRARASAGAKARVVVRFFDEHDNSIASSTQTASPGVPATVLLSYDALPASGTARVGRVETQVTPLETGGIPAPHDNTHVTMESYSELHVRPVAFVRRDREPGEGRDHGMVHQCGPGYIGEPGGCTD